MSGDTKMKLLIKLFLALLPTPPTTEQTLSTFQVTINKLEKRKESIDQTHIDNEEKIQNLVKENRSIGEEENRADAAIKALKKITGEFPQK